MVALALFDFGILSKHCINNLYIFPTTNIKIWRLYRERKQEVQYQVFLSEGEQ